MGVRAVIAAPPLKPRQRAHAAHAEAAHTFLRMRRMILFTALHGAASAGGEGGVTVLDSGAFVVGNSSVTR